MITPFQPRMSIDSIFQKVLSFLIHKKKDGKLTFEFGEAKAF